MSNTGTLDRLHSSVSHVHYRYIENNLFCAGLFNLKGLVVQGLGSKSARADIYSCRFIYVLGDLPRNIKFIIIIRPLFFVFSHRKLPGT